MSFFGGLGTLECWLQHDVPQRWKKPDEMRTLLCLNGLERERTSELTELLLVTLADVFIYCSIRTISTTLHPHHDANSNTYYLFCMVWWPIGFSVCFVLNGVCFEGLQTLLEIKISDLRPDLRPVFSPFPTHLCGLLWLWVLMQPGQCACTITSRLNILWSIQ